MTLMEKQPSVILADLLPFPVTAIFLLLVLYAMTASEQTPIQVMYESSNGRMTLG
jgi:hypothetical protein